MRCQRRILGVLWYERVINAEISRRTRLPSIINIAQRRHALFGHVRRLPSTTPAHSALHIAVSLDSGGPRPVDSWRLPRGRPRLTWISQSTRDTGLSAQELCVAAENGEE